jgi:hypothetical protein
MYGLKPQPTQRRGSHAHTLAPEVLLSCPVQSFLQCEATHAPLERCGLFFETQILKVTNLVDNRQPPYLPTLASAILRKTLVMLSAPSSER